MTLATEPPSTRTALGMGPTRPVVTIWTDADNAFITQAIDDADAREIYGKAVNGFASRGKIVSETGTEFDTFRQTVIEMDGHEISVEVFYSA